jgi:hypothetical protein
MTKHLDSRGDCDVTPPPAVIDFALRLSQQIGEWKEKCELALHSSRLSEEEVRRLRHRCEMEVAHIAELKAQVRSIALERDAEREQVARLTAERDEARIMYCNNLSPADPHKIAEKWRWNCFAHDKETWVEALDRLAKMDEENGL